MCLQEIVKKPYVENDRTLCFKTTPVAKVVILSLVSGGIYLVILLYSYWETLRKNFGYKVLPLVRALFCLVTNLWLFSILQRYLRCFNVKLLNGVFLALIFWVFGLMCPSNVLLDVLTCLPCILIVAMIQHKINEVNKRHFQNAPKNEWSIVNTIWTVILLGVFIVM